MTRLGGLLLSRTQNTCTILSVAQRLSQSLTVCMMACALSGRHSLLCRSHMSASQPLLRIPPPPTPSHVPHAGAAANGGTEELHEEVDFGKVSPQQAFQILNVSCFLVGYRVQQLSELLTESVWRSHSCTTDVPHDPWHRQHCQMQHCCCSLHCKVTLGPACCRHWHKSSLCGQRGTGFAQQGLTIRLNMRLGKPHIAEPVVRQQQTL